MSKNWKTSGAGILTGITLLINSLALPLISGDISAIDWSGVVTALGAFGLGWFASDKPSSNSEPTADEDYSTWLNK